MKPPELQSQAARDAIAALTNGSHSAPDEPPVIEGPAEHDEPPDEPNQPPTHMGQVRFAYRLANRHADRLAHVYGIGWHYWDSARWCYDDRGIAERAVLAELRRGLAESLDYPPLRKDVERCESQSGVLGVLGIARALEQFAVTTKDLDCDPRLLNCANGTLDLRTLELRPHSPADRITKVCRGSYLPAAKSVLWETFLARVLPDEDVRGFVQRLAGLALLGEVVEHILPIFIGTGANGKSVFDKALRFALGDYATTCEPDLFLARDGAHPTGLMDLMGVRLATVAESDEDRKLAAALMKRLTGGDTIKARRMRKNFVEFEPSHTCMLVTNHLPKVSGDDAAIWRRLRVVPFDVVIPEDEQDRTLDARLQLEADGILAWAIEGYQNYGTRGLDEPESVKVATDNYQHNSDAIARFIDEACVCSVQVRATTHDLYEAWQKWQPSDGAAPLSRKAFGQALDRRGYPAGAPDRGKRWRRGIAVLTTESEDE